MRHTEGVVSDVDGSKIRKWTVLFRFWAFFSNNHQSRPSRTQVAPSSHQQNNNNNICDLGEKTATSNYTLCDLRATEFKQQL